MTHSAVYLRTRTVVRYAVGFTFLGLVCSVLAIAATY